MLQKLQLMTLGEKICTFIAHYVLIPEGAHVGQAMKLMKFQKQFILEVYDNPAGTRRAYVSVAPKISKLFSRWLWIRKRPCEMGLQRPEAIACGATKQAFRQ